MVILAKVELSQCLLTIDLHVTIEPIKYPDTFHDFATRLQFILYVGLNYQQERLYDFFQFLDLPLHLVAKY